MREVHSLSLCHPQMAHKKRFLPVDELLISILLLRCNKPRRAIRGCAFRAFCLQ